MKQHVHFLGIGGSGASAVAAIAQAEGFDITGCDKNPHNEFTSVFNQKSLFDGHSPHHLDTVDILAVTPAIFSLDPNNPELISAKELAIEVLTWQQFMGKYLEVDKFVIAICGTHGKSTTTAMTGLMLEEANLDPTVELGAIIPKWTTNYRVGKGKYFVTEADEFNDNFLASTPTISIVTTVEMDHPEFFKDFEDYKQSFKEFLLTTKQVIIANLSDPGVKDILSQSEFKNKPIIDYSTKLINFPLQVPGRYNILNASAVYQLGLSLNIDPLLIQKSLERYLGIYRRFEYMGSVGQVKVYNDFGHHPTEVKVTMEAAIDKFGKKICLIYQPHMFKRTHALFPDFVKVFQDLPIDQILITDIYPSREVDTGLVSSLQLVDAVGKTNVVYIKNDQILDKLNIDYNQFDVIFFMGAGEIYNLANKFVNGQ